MTFADILRLRARFYGRVALWALLPAIVGIAAVTAWWMPSPAANTAFSHVQVDWHLTWWWHENVAHIFPNASQDATISRYQTGLGGFAVCIVGALVLLFRKRPVLAVLLFALVFVENTVVDGVTDRAGTTTVEADAVPAGTLGAIADDPGQVSAVFDKIVDPKVLWRDALGHTSRDMHHFSPASVSSALHYILAQKAYLDNDPVEVRRRLQGVDPVAVPPDSINIYRLNAMREWVAARGHPAAGHDFVRKGYEPSVRWRRPLAWAGLVMAALALIFSAAAAGLAAVLSRRAVRLDDLAAVIAAKA